MYNITPQYSSVSQDGTVTSLKLAFAERFVLKVGRICTEENFQEMKDICQNFNIQREETNIHTP